MFSKSNQPPKAKPMIADDQGLFKQREHSSASLPQFFNSGKAYEATVKKLKNPLQVCNMLTRFENTNYRNKVQGVASNLFHDQQNPEVWLLLDDNLEEFKKSFDPNISCLTCLYYALALGRHHIADFLLHHIRAELCEEGIEFLLQAAFFSGDKTMVDKVLTLAEQQKIKPLIGFLALRNAIRSRNLMLVTMVLEKLKQTAFTRFSTEILSAWHDFVLNEAVQFSTTTILQKLMDFARDQCLSRIITPKTLAHAILSGDPQMVNFVIELYRHENQSSSNLYQSLEANEVFEKAVLSGKAEMLDKVIEDNKPLGRTLNLTQPLFCKIVASGNVPLFYKLQTEQLLPDMQLLIHAAQSGNLAMLKEVLTMASLRGLALKPNLEVLHAAIRSGNPAMFEKVYALITPLQVGLQSLISKEALMLAIESGNEKMVAKLFQKVEAAKKSLKIDQSHFNLAIERGNMVVLESLFKAASQSGYQFQPNMETELALYKTPNPLLRVILKNYKEQSVNSTSTLRP